MASKLSKIQAYVVEQITELMAEKEEIDEIVNDDFDPADASGGNFDDAYEMGEEHGENYGRIQALIAVKAILDGEDE